jgi:hypothetical protein
MVCAVQPADKRFVWHFACHRAPLLRLSFVGNVLGPLTYSFMKITPIVAPGMRQKQYPARQLACRLYTICERPKWAQEARAYNELITSWPAIVGASQKAGLVGKPLDFFGFAEQADNG